jgi:hypothetical protein
MIKSGSPNSGTSPWKDKGGMQLYSDGVNVVINTFYLGFQPFFARQAAKRRWNSHHVSDAELVPFLGSIRAVKGHSLWLSLFLFIRLVFSRFNG